MQFRAAYTLGTVIATAPDATAVVPVTANGKHASNPANFDTDRTIGNNDQRHRLVVSAMWDTGGIAARQDGVMKAIVGGWSVSAILTAQSGQPYSARVGSIDLNRDGNTRNDLAPGTVRNQFVLPAQATLDPRLARTFAVGGARLTLIAEAFNVLN